MLSVVRQRSRFLFSSPVRVASRSFSYELSFVRKVFENIHSSLKFEDKDPDMWMNIKLKEVILINHCEDAMKRYQQPSRLAGFDAAIPRDWSLERKVNEACERRKKYYIEFALTGHPTELLSEEKRRAINRIVKWVVELGRFRPSSPEALVLKHKIEQDIHAEYHCSWLQQTSLSPENEGERQDALYLDMMDSWPEFNHRNIAQFIAAHDVTNPEQIDYVKAMLTDANKYSYQNGWSWFLADRDGNFKKTALTMARMNPGLQTAILNWYMEKIEPLLEKVPQLQSTYDYMQRCKKTIAHGIYYNEKRANKAQEKLLLKLSKVIAIHPFSKELLHLRDLVDIVGFKGHLKQFLRQSSKVIEAVFDDVFQILGEHYSEVKQLLHDPDSGVIRTYSLLPLSEKQEAQAFLRADAQYFNTLKHAAEQFSSATNREIEVFSFVWTHREQFACIISDTKDSNSLIEAIHLFAMAAHFKGELFIDDVRESPVELIPLCETASDLANLPDIIGTMLADPYLNEGIKTRQRICYLAGPSDIGSKEGEFKHIDLIWAEAEIGKVLKAFKAKDPALAGVKVHVFHGAGNDSERQISRPDKNLFSTRQGDAASTIAEPGAFSANVEDVAGHPSENTRRAQELALLERNYPDKTVRLKRIIQKSVDAYHAYNDHPMSHALLQRLSVPKLGRWLNRSSRDEAAKVGATEPGSIAVAPDMSKARAIGKVNYNRAMLFLVRRFISADVLIDLSDDECRDLPLFFAESTVVRELFLKCITAIAVSDFSRTWRKINDGVVPSPVEIKQWADEYNNPAIHKTLHHMVAYAHYRADLMLRKIASAFYEPDSKQANVYFAAIEPLSQSPNELALGLLESGVISQDLKKLAATIRYDLLPRYKRLEKCLDRYQNNPDPSDIIIENMVYALRVDRRISTWPDEISHMRSGLSDIPVDTVELNVDDHLNVRRFHLKPN